MNASSRPSLATHYLRYGIGNALVLVAGFISFPILTRLLSNEQYGIFSYFEVWLLVLLALIKFGAQHSILRLYPHGRGEQAVREFVASFLLVPFRHSLVLWLVAGIGYGVVSTGLEGEVRAVGWCMIALLLPQVWISFVNALIGAEERSAQFMRQMIAQRWLEMLAIVGAVALVQHTALAAYSGRVLAAAVMALWLWWWLRHEHSPSLREARPAEWIASLSFSLPLVANEVTGALLALLDRVMLKHLLSDFTPVGIFAIGAGLAATLSSVLNQTMSLAFAQVSVRQYALDGAAVVVETKRGTLRFMIYVYVLLAAGLACVGSDFMLLLSGHDKGASAPVFVAIGCCYVVYGLVDLCGSGLLLQKRSKTVLALNASAMLLGASLNLLLIPRLGVHGAVYSTLASYSWLGIGQYLLCPRELRALPDGRATLIACALGIGYAACVHLIWMLGSIETPIMRLATAALMVPPAFVLPAALLDPFLRKRARDWLARSRS